VLKPDESTAKSFSMVLRGAESALQMLVGEVFGSIADRAEHVAKNAVISYAYQRHHKNDPEWVEVCKRSLKVRKWVLKGKT
jgi:hypothetical protein